MPAQRKPMKRSGFKRKPMQPEDQIDLFEAGKKRKQRTPAHDDADPKNFTVKSALVRINTGTYRCSVPVPAPKREYIRSKAVLEACRTLPCQHCGAMDGTVCAAHSNWSVHGKGGHIKADDNRVASLCAACHVPVLDQGSRLSKKERQHMWWRAHFFTVKKLVLAGTWPVGVPVPDIETNPFEA